MKLISVVTPCFNEESNVYELYKQVKDVFNDLPEYQYEHIFIDNASKDNSVKKLKEIAANDKNVKIIVNIKNFGPIRSPAHGMFQATGDAVVYIVCDLQEPPTLIKEFIKKWEEGHRVVIGVRKKNKENILMKLIRDLFYFIIGKLSEIEHIDNFAGFGLYDRSFIEVYRQLNDPYPYLRGVVAEYGYSRAIVPYTHEKRKGGKTSTYFYMLYDIAILGITNHSKVPLRVATFIGFNMALLCLLVAIGYLIYKILFWNQFQLGLAPIVIGLFFFTSIQLFFTGIIGEYIGNIFTHVKNHPLVIEKERINFDK